MARKGKPMGTIYPKKIKRLIEGESSTKIQVGYTGDGELIIRKDGEHWVDKDGKEWEMKDGIARSVPKFQDVRVPMFCPKCKKVMRRKQDTDIYWRFGFCLDCLIERDTQMMIDGTFEDYEKNYIRNKRLGFLKDAKIGIEEYLVSLDSDVEFVNEDGSIEKWDKAKVTELKEFWEKELKEVNDTIDELEKETITGEV